MGQAWPREMQLVFTGIAENWYFIRLNLRYDLHLNVVVKCVILNWFKLGWYINVINVVVRSVSSILIHETRPLPDYLRT